MRQFDADVLASFNEKMDVMADLIRGVAANILPGVIISGPPGVGKSFILNQVLESEFPDKMVTIYKGKITPLALYQGLLGSASDDSIVVFDDCDSAFEDISSLNLLKGALDPTTKRMVSWNTSNGRVDVPRFYFNGGIIILTNTRVSRSPHYGAFTDRVHALDLDFTMEEKVAKIAEIVVGSDSIPEELGHEILTFIYDHMDSLKDRVSLRLFNRLLELTRVSKNWKALAKLTVLKDS